MNIPSKESPAARNCTDKQVKIPAAAKSKETQKERSNENAVKASSDEINHQESSVDPNKQKSGIKNVNRKRSSMSKDDLIMNKKTKQNDKNSSTDQIDQILQLKCELGKH